MSKGQKSNKEARKPKKIVPKNNASQPSAKAGGLPNLIKR